MKKNTAFLIGLLMVAFVFYSCGAEEEVFEDPENTNMISDFPPSNWIPEIDELNPFGSQSTVLSGESPSFSHQDVSLSLLPGFVDSLVTLNVKPVKFPDNWQGASYSAYEFKFDDKNFDPGVIEIRLPFINNGDDMIVGAGYFNTETQEWEPVLHEVDYVNNEVIILTDHLSVYSCFSLTGEGTRYARISTIFGTSPHQNLDDKYNQVILEAANNNMRPGQAALDLGLQVTTEWLGLSGAGLTLQGLAYSSEFLSGFSNALTNVGGALSLLQVVADLSRGEPKMAGANALKNALGFAVSKFGSAALQVAFVGVFAIDYSLGKFYSEAISGREQIYIDAYNRYYSRNSTYGAPSFKVKNNVDWYRTFRNITAEAKNPQEANKKIEEAIDNYVNHFWKDASGMAFAFADVNPGFSYGGGSKKELEEKISANFKATLINSDFQPVFDRLVKENQIQQHREYINALNEVKEKLNQFVQFEVREVQSEHGYEYAGFIYRFEPLNEDVEPKKWTGRLNKEAKSSGSFTVLGHLLAGAPDKLVFYKNSKNLEAEKIAMEIPITIEVPYTEIIIGEEEFELEGIWEMEATIKSAELRASTSSISSLAETYDDLFDDEDGQSVASDVERGREKTEDSMIGTSVDMPNLDFDVLKIGHDITKEGKYYVVKSRRFEDTQSLGGSKYKIRFTSKTTFVGALETRTNWGGNQDKIEYEIRGKRIK